MLLFIGVSLVIIFGYLFSLLIVKEMHLLERLGVSFLLGFGIFTLLMFCYSSFGIKITTESTIITLAIGISLLFVFLKLFRGEVFKNPLTMIKRFSTFSILEQIIVYMIVALMTGSLVLSIYFPVYIWDALALYDFRARIIAQQGFYTQIANSFSYFAGYPLFTSLSHTIVYLFKGNNPQFLYSFMYISFIFIFYTILRQFTDRKKTLIITLLLASIVDIFDHSTFAYTNLPYTIFLTIGSMYLFTWFAKKKPVGYLVLAGIFTGLSTWSRAAEPFWIINMLVLVLLTLSKFRKFALPALIYTVSFMIIKLPWNLIINDQSAAADFAVYSAITADVNSYIAKLSVTMFSLDRIGEVAVFIYKNVIVSWFPLFFLFLFYVFVNFKDFFKKTSTLFLTIIFLYFILLVTGSYVFSFNFSEWINIPNSAGRMAMFFLPLMVFYIGLSLGELKDKH
jgi:hypothetical protein